MSTLERRQERPGQPGTRHGGSMRATVPPNSPLVPAEPSWKRRRRVTMAETAKLYGKWNFEEVEVRRGRRAWAWGAPSAAITLAGLTDPCASEPAPPEQRRRSMALHPACAAHGLASGSVNGTEAGRGTAAVAPCSSSTLGSGSARWGRLRLCRSCFSAAGGLEDDSGSERCSYGQRASPPGAGLPPPAAADVPPSPLARLP